MATRTALARWTPWLICLGLGVFALLGWLRAVRPGDQARLDRADEPAREELRQRLADAGYTERVRIINRLGLEGGAATGPLIEALREAGTDRVRIAALARLGQIATPDAVRELEDFVGHGARRLQHHAIAALGRAGTPRAVEALAALLAAGSPAAANRSAVIRALGEAGGDRAIATLTRLAADPGETERERAVHALGATGSEQALVAIRGFLSDELEEIRVAAVGALGDLGTPTARDELDRLCRTGPASLREAAVQALGAFGGDAVQARLAGLLGDRDPRIAKAALLALTRMDGPLATGAMRAALGSSSAELRAEAAEALAERGDPEGVPSLIRELHGNRHPYWIARQLASSADPAARAALLAAVATGKGESASAAVRALGAVRGKAVDDALLAAMQRGSPGVATEALEQLAKRRGRAALPLLLGALREGGGELRGAALTAVAELGEPSTRGLLLEAAKQQDRYARTAVRGLVKLGGRDLPETLLSIFKSGRSAAGEALEALAELGGPRARGALLDGLASSDHRVNYAATSGLARSRDPELGSKLQQMIADPAVSAEAKQRILSVWADREDRGALLEATRSPDRAVVKEALEVLGKCGGPDAERALGGAIDAGEAAQRQAAVKGLRELATPGAVRSLGQALLQPKLLEDATAALAAIGSRDAMRAVSDRYLAGSAEDRLTILGQLGDDPNPWSRTLLATAIESGDQRIALAAGKALTGYLPDAERRRLLESLRGSGEGATASLLDLRSRLSAL